MLTVRQRKQADASFGAAKTDACSKRNWGRTSFRTRTKSNLLKSLRKCQTPQIRLDIEPFQETDSSIVIGARRLEAPFGEWRPPNEKGESAPIFQMIPTLPKRKKSWRWQDQEREGNGLRNIMGERNNEFLGLSLNPGNPLYQRNSYPFCRISSLKNNF